MTDEVKATADRINAQLYYEGARRHIDGELWRVVSEFIEHDPRVVQVALEASLQLMAVTWLATYQALDTSHPGALDRLKRLREHLLRQLDLVRQILASAAPDVTAEQFGLVQAPKTPPDSGV